VCSGANLIGFELIVEHIDSALALFVDGLGLELVERRTSIDPAGEIAILAAGDAAITLLQPATSGPGHLMAKREPRLSQIIFSVDKDQLDELAADITDAGLPVQGMGGTRFFVPPPATEGLLGFPTAIVVAGIENGAPFDAPSDEG
jgi:catechol 2,3-dioxygenase-like lactoylglutathione lyase family enzyme